MKVRRKLARAQPKRNAAATRAKILDAAIAEFGERGFAAAKTDDIAERCGANKRMIYYYFASKRGLYLAALEFVFERLVALEREIDVAHLDPPAAIEATINLKIDYYVQNPSFVSFLLMENFHRAAHLRKSKKLELFKTPLTDVVARILKRGQRNGQFRKDVEPVDFYISICALCIMYFSNQHTLGVIFGREMTSLASIARRKRTVVDLVLSYLKVGGTASLQRWRRTGGYVSLVS